MARGSRGASVGSRMGRPGDGPDPAGPRNPLSLLSTAPPQQRGAAETRWRGDDCALAGVLVTATLSAGCPAGTRTVESAYTRVHPGCAATVVTGDHVKCREHDRSTPTRQPTVWTNAAGVT